MVGGVTLRVTRQVTVLSLAAIPPQSSMDHSVPAWRQMSAKRGQVMSCRGGTALGSPPAVSPSPAPALPKSHPYTTQCSPHHPPGHAGTPWGHTPWPRPHDPPVPIRSPQAGWGWGMQPLSAPLAPWHPQPRCHLPSAPFPALGWDVAADTQPIPPHPSSVSPSSAGHGAGNRKSLRDHNCTNNKYEVFLTRRGQQPRRPSSGLALPPSVPERSLLLGVGHCRVPKGSSRRESRGRRASHSLLQQLW